MRSNRAVAIVFFLLICIGFVLILDFYYTPPPPDIGLMTDSVPEPECEFPTYALLCQSYAFDAQSDSFELTLMNLLPDVLVENLTLLQDLLGNNVNCWLNLSELPTVRRYNGTYGLLIKKGETIRLNLSCTPFDQVDIGAGVWHFDTRVYWIKDGILHPANLTSDLHSHFSDGTPVKPQGFLKINYYACGQDKGEWCARHG